MEGLNTDSRMAEPTREADVILPGSQDGVFTPGPAVADDTQEEASTTPATESEDDEATSTDSMSSDDDGHSPPRRAGRGRGHRGMRPGRRQGGRAAPSLQVPHIPIPTHPATWPGTSGDVTVPLNGRQQQGGSVVMPKAGGTKPGKSQRYTGVYNQSCGRWRAQYCHGGLVHQLGMYDSEEAAAQAWDRVAWVYRGTGALLNFPNLTDHYDTPESKQAIHELMDERMQMRKPRGTSNRAGHPSATATAAQAADTDAIQPPYPAGQQSGPARTGRAGAMRKVPNRYIPVVMTSHDVPAAVRSSGVPPPSLEGSKPSPPVHSGGTRLPPNVLQPLASSGLLVCGGGGTPFVHAGNGTLPLAPIASAMGYGITGDPKPPVPADDAFGARGLGSPVTPWPQRGRGRPSADANGADGYVPFPERTGGAEHHPPTPKRRRPDSSNGGVGGWVAGAGASPGRSTEGRGRGEGGDEDKPPQMMFTGQDMVWESVGAGGAGGGGQAQGNGGMQAVTAAAVAAVTAMAHFAYLMPPATDTDGTTPSWVVPVANSTADTEGRSGQDHTKQNKRQRAAPLHVPGSTALPDLVHRLAQGAPPLPLLSRQSLERLQVRADPSSSTAAAMMLSQAPPTDPNGGPLYSPGSVAHTGSTKRSVPVLESYRRPPVSSAVIASPASVSKLHPSLRPMSTASPALDDGAGSSQGLNVLAQATALIAAQDAAAAATAAASEFSGGMTPQVAPLGQCSPELDAQGKGQHRRSPVSPDAAHDVMPLGGMGGSEGMEGIGGMAGMDVAEAPTRLMVVDPQFEGQPLQALRVIPAPSAVINAAQQPVMDGTMQLAWATQGGVAQVPMPMPGVSVPWPTPAPVVWSVPGGALQPVPVVQGGEHTADVGVQLHQPLPDGGDGGGDPVMPGSRGETMHADGSSVSGGTPAAALEQPASSQQDQGGLILEADGAVHHSMSLTGGNPTPAVQTWTPSALDVNDPHVHPHPHPMEVLARCTQLDWDQQFARKSDDYRGVFLRTVNDGGLWAAVMEYEVSGESRLYLISEHETETEAAAAYDRMLELCNGPAEWRNLPQTTYADVGSDPGGDMIIVKIEEEASSDRSQGQGLQAVAKLTPTSAGSAGGEARTSIGDHPVPTATPTTTPAVSTSLRPASAPEPPHTLATPPSAPSKTNLPPTQTTSSNTPTPSPSKHAPTAASSPAPTPSLLKRALVPAPINLPPQGPRSPQPVIAPRHPAHCTITTTSPGTNTLPTKPPLPSHAPHAAYHANTTHTTATHTPTRDPRLPQPAQTAGPGPNPQNPLTNQVRTSTRNPSPSHLTTTSTFPAAPTPTQQPHPRAAQPHQTTTTISPSFHTSSSPRTFPTQPAPDPSALPHNPRSQTHTAAQPYLESNTQSHLASNSQMQRPPPFMSITTQGTDSNPKPQPRFMEPLPRLTPGATAPYQRVPPPHQSVLPHHQHVPPPQQPASVPPPNPAVRVFIAGEHSTSHAQTPVPIRMLTIPNHNLTTPSQQPFHTPPPHRPHQHQPQNPHNHPTDTQQYRTSEPGNNQHQHQHQHRPQLVSLPSMTVPPPNSPGSLTPFNTPTNNRPAIIPVPASGNLNLQVFPMDVPPPTPRLGARLAAAGSQAPNTNLQPPAPFVQTVAHHQMQPHTHTPALAPAGPYDTSDAAATQKRGAQEGQPQSVSAGGTDWSLVLPPQVLQLLKSMPDAKFQLQYNNGVPGILMQLPAAATTWTIGTQQGQQQQQQQ